MSKDKAKDKETESRFELMEQSLGTELVDLGSDLFIRKHGAMDHIYLQSTIPGGEGCLVASADALPALHRILTRLLSSREERGVPEK